MWKKLGKLIINNFGLKVLAAVLAIIIWLAIVNTDDVEKSVTFTVPVEIINADYLEEEGKTYEVLENSDTISFTVNGKRSIVETLTEDDFRAIANMENIDDSMSMVPISLTATRYSSQLEITRMDSYLMVEVDNMVTREFEIEIIVEGSPANGYYVYDSKADPGVVNISGPETLVDEIESVRTSIVVSNADQTFTDVGVIQLINGMGIVNDEERLTMDIDQTDVTATIYMRKEVPIEFEVTGEPAEGYWYTDPECDTDTIKIEGDPDVISGIESITLDSSKINIEGASEDVTRQIKLSDALPDGVSLIEGEPDEVTVTVPVVEAETVEVQIPADNITVAGLPENLSLTISTDPVAVTLTGTEPVLDSVDSESLAGTIDASGMGIGLYTVTVPLETDGSYKAEAEISVSVTGTDTTGS